MFIVGMPRSGTTLVEQVIAAHSRAAGAGEREGLKLAVHEIAPQTARDRCQRELDGGIAGQFQKQTAGIGG